MPFAGQDTSLQALWQAALGSLEIQMGPASFQTWLKDSQAVAFDGRVLEVATPNIFAREWLEQRLHSLVGDTIASLLGREVAVRFLFSAEAAPSPPNHRYSFASLVPGDFNRLACASAQEVLASPGKRYNPLVLWGGTGVGKTHLLQAMGLQAGQRGLRGLYLTGEQFTNQFIAALRHQQAETFRQSFQRLELCLVDDLQFLQGKGQTLQAFFHIFNELYEADCQLVLASSEPPNTLNGVEERLRSRLLSGLLVKVENPGEQDRHKLLHALAQRLSLTLPPEVTSLLAHRAPGNIRELEGILNRIQSLSKVHSTPVTLDLAAQVLGQDPSPPPTPTHIVKTVLSHFHLPPDAFQKRQPGPNISQARLIAIYLLREQGYSLSQIGEAVGGLAKSSVLTYYRKAQQALPISPGLDQLITELKNRATALG